MNSKVIIIGGIIIVLIVAGIIITHSNSTNNRSNLNNTITKTLSIKETFNLSNYLNKTLTGNVTYSDALSQAYASNHSQNEFYYFLSSLPTIKIYQTGTISANLTQNSKVVISGSSSQFLINLNNYYGYITISGSYDNITIENGLYNICVETTGTAKGDKISYKDAYEVKPW